MLAKFKSFIPAFVTACMLVVVSGAFAQSTGGSDLPDTGVDVPALLTAAITKIGAAAVIAVAGYFAFLAIKKAMTWARSMA